MLKKLNPINDIEVSSQHFNNFSFIIVQSKVKIRGGFDEQISVNVHAIIKS